MLPDWKRAARAAALAAWLAAPGLAQAEAGGPYIPAALAIPATASRAQAFVPDGFVLESETTGDLGAAYPGVAQVYHNAAGRRALLIGLRTPQGFEATGWGFVLPCQDCGIDLPADRNLQVAIREQRVMITDRSASQADDTTTDAELTLRYDAASARWLLSTLRQLTVNTATGHADESVVDYDQAVTRDASGRYDGATFTPQTIQTGQPDGDQPALDTLVLY